MLLDKVSFSKERVTKCSPARVYKVTKHDNKRFYTSALDLYRKTAQKLIWVETKKKCWQSPNQIWWQIWMNEKFGKCEGST